MRIKRAQETNHGEIRINQVSGVRSQERLKSYESTGKSEPDGRDKPAASRERVSLRPDTCHLRPARQIFLTPDTWHLPLIYNDAGLKLCGVKNAAWPLPKSIPS